MAVCPGDISGYGKSLRYQCRLLDPNAKLSWKRLAEDWVELAGKLRASQFHISRADSHWNVHNRKAAHLKFFTNAPKVG